MKIEMGESLLYSWLRHVKGCQITQTNWSGSSNWELHNKDRLLEIMNKTSIYFFDKYGIEIFKRNKLMQLLKQAEVDVIGISFTPEPYAYGVEVAFHEDGLNYGNKDTTVTNIIKKYIRAILCLMGYFNFTEGEIIFATPCTTKSVLNELLPKLDELNKILKELNVNYKIKFFTESDFYNSILSPIMLVSDNVSDTSELFMRGYQMLKLFEKEKHQKKQPVTNKLVSVQSHDTYLNMAALDELKIGKLVQITMNYMAKNDQLTDSMIESLTNKDYSKKTFNINFPMLKKSYGSDCEQLRLDDRGYFRYYSNPIIIREEKYLLCQEWKEPLHRKQYDEWYKNIIKL